MKPGDQIKVIALSFFSIVVMIGVITMVSIMTTRAVASHGGEHGGEHGEESHASSTMNTNNEAHGTSDAHDASATEHGAEKTVTDASPAASKDAEHGSEKAVSTETKDAHHDTDDKGHSVQTESETAKVSAVGGDVEKGKEVFKTKTCTVCHAVSSVEGAVGTIGPKLDGLSKVAATRVPGLSAVDYIKQSIEEPNKFVVKDFAPAMTPLRGNMSDEEFTNLVAFLSTL